MTIETLEENEKKESPVVGVYDIKLKVGDGVRFGLGFGLGMFLWAVLFCAGIYFIFGTIILGSMFHGMF